MPVFKVSADTDKLAQRRRFLRIDRQATGPAAADKVSTRSSRFIRWMPQALNPSTISSSSASERPSRSRRDALRMSPGLAWSISLVSSGRSAAASETMSVQTRIAPASSSRSCSPAASWPQVETRA